MGNVLTDTSDGTGFPAWTGATWDKAAVLRYGENPHQPAALYRALARRASPRAEQLHGKEMSYNNYVDTDAARRAAYDFAEPAVAIIKHANPCGIAVGADVAEAHRKAHACDPISAFGGVIAANRPVSVAMAEQVAEVFTEVIVAPAYDDGAVEVLQGKKNIRILVCAGRRAPGPVEFRGDQRRAADAAGRPRRRARATTRPPGRWPPARPPPDEVLADLAFAWRACRAVKSNAILLAKRRRLGRHRHGPGQPGRLLPARRRSGPGERAAGSVAASDAFFPFEDGPQILIDAGVTRHRPARRLGARRADRRGGRRPRA